MDNLYSTKCISYANLYILNMKRYLPIILSMTFNFGHKCTTNESNANHLKSIFNKIILSLELFY